MYTYKLQILYLYTHIYIMFAHGRGERKEKTTEKNIGYFTKLGF